MSVEVSPRDYLGFQRPFNNPVTSNLKLHNPHHKPIVVKIKVTSPKAYCVRPNSSRIEPGETLDVNVILQPMKEQPPPGAKCKDKFLICSAVIPVEKESLALTEFWYELEKTNKAAIKEHKLRVAYLSDSETIPEDAAGEVSRYHDAGFGTPGPNRETSSVSTPVSSHLQQTQFHSQQSPSPFNAQATGNGNGNGFNSSSIAPGLPYPAVPIHVTNVQTQNSPSPLGPAPVPAHELSSGSRGTASGTPGAGAPGYELGDAKEQGAAVPSPAVISTSTSSAAITAPAANESKPTAPTLQRQNTVPKPEINSLAQTVVHTVEDQLDHAKQEIMLLQRQLAESGFGQKVKSAVNDVGDRAESIGVNGVQGYTFGVLLAVAVAAFAIGYLYNRSA